VQYEIIAWGSRDWGKAASCHLQPISVVLNRAMKCLSTYEIETPETTGIFVKRWKFCN